MGEDFWIILGTSNGIVRKSADYSSDTIIFAETDIVFYGSLTFESKVVGFDIHQMPDEIFGRFLPYPYFDKIGASLFPAFILQEGCASDDVIENGEELFGDISLHQKRDGEFAFLFHSIDSSHPLAELLQQKADESQ